MSSVARGNAFENRVFAAIAQELGHERLGLAPRACRAYQKKGYYSRDRGADIVVDISIEVWLPGADRWSMLWVCECKDYRGAIPVNDVEEFKAKLDQIAGANKKGVLAVSGALQEGALNYARAQGIGVVRLVPGRDLEHLQFGAPGLARQHDLRTPTAEECQIALTVPEFVASRRDFYAESQGRPCASWHELLAQALRA